MSDVIFSPAPKPAPRVKKKREAKPRKAIARKTRLKSSGRIPSKPRSKEETERRTRIKPRNAKRRASEFERAYGGESRVAFVKAQGWCIGHLVCDSANCRGPIDNAHTEGGGKGRKGPASSIVPACRHHHQCFDEHRAPFDSAEARARVREQAPIVERRWRAYAGRGE